jgi:hypothetical protein
MRQQSLSRRILAIPALALLQGQRCAPPSDPVGGCTELSGAIAENTTLVAGCYEVTQDLTVNPGVTLTIDPGVTLKFAEDVQMTVGPGGSLRAIGTASNPIVLTGMQQARGYWGGLRFYDFDSNDGSELNNQLDYVTIEYGGGYLDANLLVAYSGGVAVNNCTIRNSGSYGFHIANDESIVSAFANNTVTSNASGAGLVFANHIQYLEDSSDYAGNDVDVVVVEASVVDEDQTWPDIGIPYYVDTTVGLDVSANLVLSPGVTLIFDDADEHMEVTGSLYAVGTEDKPITMTAAQAVAGGWGGLRIYDTDSENNRLEYVTISYGGGYHNANLRLNGSGVNPARASVRNCTFSNSAGWGIYWIPEYVTVDGDLAGDNSFSNNATGDVGTP